MTILSFIIIAYIIYFCFFEKADIEDKYFQLLGITAAVEILNMASPFLQIGSSTMSIQFALEGMLIVYSIKYLKYKQLKVNFELFKLSLLFYAVCVGGILYEIISPYDVPIVNHTTYLSWDGLSLGVSNKSLVEISWGWTILCFYKVLFFLTQVLTFKLVINDKRLVELLGKIIKIVYVDVYCGWMEFVVRNVINMEYVTYVYTLVTHGKYVETTYRNDITALCGLEKEPAHFVITLFILSICMVIWNEIAVNNIHMKKYGLRNFIFIFPIMILSGGFSCLWLLPMFVICRFFIKNRGKTIFQAEIIKKLFVALGIFLVGWSLISLIIENSEYFQEKIYYMDQTINFLLSGKLIYSAQYTSSIMSRLVSIYDTIYDFINRPVLGLGLGVEICHGGLGNLLSQSGILGAFILYKIFNYSRYKGQKYDRILLLVYVFLVNLPLDLYIYPYTIFYLIIYESTSLYVKNNMFKGA